MGLTEALVVFVVCLAACSGQRVSLGDCPEIDVVKGFDLKKYVGKWFEIEKNPTPFEAGLKCNTAEYENKGEYISVRNRGIRIRDGEESVIEGRATVPDPKTPAKLKVKFDSMPFSADYWVLDTDYKQFSVVYSCFSVLKSVNFEYLWILSRTPSLEEKTKQTIYSFLEKNNITTSELSKTEQDCSAA